MDLHHPSTAASRPTTSSSSPNSFSLHLLGEKAWGGAAALLVLLSVLILLNVDPESFLISTGVLLRRPPAGETAAATAAPPGCDYSYGRWVWDESLSRRTYSEDCRFLDPGFRCRRNGRKDDGYGKWRWQPHGCDLPRFNASDMLERNRNARIVFAGDSIGRNHWESLVCMLASAVGGGGGGGGADKSGAVYEQNGNPITKHKGYLAIRFRDYNLTVEYYRTPFLVPVDRPPPTSPPQVKRAVRVDRLHWRSRQWAGADVLVFNAGHWWSQDKTFKMGCYFQEGDRVNTSMDVREAFRRSLQTWRRWVVQNLHAKKKSYVFFRSYSPVHYNGGTWDTGGHCDRNTAPETPDQRLVAEPAPYWSINRDISDAVEQIRAAAAAAGEMRRRKKTKKLQVQFLNITYLTELRRDGHPSVHREPGTPAAAPQDCSHWCLPGVPDTWNHLLYAHLLVNYDGH